MAKKTKKMAKKPVKKTAPRKAAKKTARPAAKAVSRTSTKAAPTSKLPKVRAVTRPKSSSGAYTQSEFLENIRAFCGFTKRTEAKELVEDLAVLIKDSLRRGFKIPIFGLGKMYVRHSKARTGRNPATGAEITIPARKRVRFTPAKALKEAVL